MRLNLRWRPFRLHHHPHRRYHENKISLLISDHLACHILIENPIYVSTHASEKPARKGASPRVSWHSHHFAVQGLHAKNDWGPVWSRCCYCYLCLCCFSSCCCCRCCCCGWRRCRERDRMPKMWCNTGSSPTSPRTPPLTLTADTTDDTQALRSRAVESLLYKEMIRGTRFQVPLPRTGTLGPPPIGGQAVECRPALAEKGRNVQGAWGGQLD